MLAQTTDRLVVGMRFRMSDLGSFNSKSSYKTGVVVVPPGRAVTMKTPKPRQRAEQEVRRVVTLARQGVRASKMAAALGRYAGSVRRIARTKRILLNK